MLFGTFAMEGLLGGSVVVLRMRQRRFIINAMKPISQFLNAAALRQFKACVIPFNLLINSFHGALPLRLVVSSRAADAST